MYILNYSYRLRLGVEPEATKEIGDPIKKQVSADTVTELNSAFKGIVDNHNYWKYGPIYFDSIEMPGEIV